MLELASSTVDGCTMGIAMATAFRLNCYREEQKVCCFPRTRAILFTFFGDQLERHCILAECINKRGMG